MLIIDDILLFPVRSFTWIMRQIKEAADEEIENRGERITAELSELYMQLDTGKITEEEFEAQEQELLDELDEIEDYKKGSTH